MRRARPVLALAVAIAAVGLGACASSAVDAGAPAGSVPPTSEAATTATAAPGTTAPAPTTTTSMPPPLPAPSPPIASPGDNKVFVLGDSVILGAKTQIPAALTGWKVTFDAKESRFITQGIDVLKAHKSDDDKARAQARAELEQAYKDAGKPAPPPEPAPSLVDVLGRVVVVSLCTNYQAGGGFGNQIDSYMTYLKGVDRVVWVTCGEWSPGQTEANAAVRAAAGRYPNLVIADWAAFSPTPGYTYDDGIHLKPPAQEEMAALLARAVGPAPTPKPAAPTTTRPKPTVPPSTEPPTTAG
jgi:hypothetical protein